MTIKRVAASAKVLSLSGSFSIDPTSSFVLNPQDSPIYGQPDSAWLRGPKHIQLTPKARTLQTTQAMRTTTLSTIASMAKLCRPS